MISTKKFFVTGTDTDIGKTVVSAVLTQKLKADYWKPIQSGDLNNSDTDKVKRLVENTQTFFHQETFRLNTPASPHLAAKIDDVSIHLEDFKLPKTTNNLIVEGAGGLMVPINEEHLVIDLIKQLDIPVILVSKNYLGSINHTLLSVDALTKRRIPIAGIVINGDQNEETERIIEVHGKVKILGHVPTLNNLSSETITNTTNKIDWI